MLSRLRNAHGVREVIAVQQRYSSERAGLYADALTYQAFLSIIPLLLVASSVAGFILEDPAERAQLVGRLTGVIPGFGGTIGTTLESIVSARGPIGLIGLVGLVWRGTSAVRATGTALCSINGCDEEKNPAQKILWAFGASLVLGLFAVASIALGVLGALLPAGIGPPIAFLASFATDIALFLVAYKVLTPGDGPKPRDLVPGAIVAASGWQLLKFVGSMIAERSLANASAVYGSLGVAIAILIMLSFAARIFLYGAVVNAISDEGGFEKDPATKPVSGSARSARA